ESRYSINIPHLLCRSRGCMEYSELHRAVRQRYSLSDQDLLAFLGDTSRFIVTGDSSQSGVAGPQPGAASRVIAKTSVRLCQMHECDGRACQNLHLCKYLVCGQCGRGKKCKYSHKVHSSHNSNILTEEGLQDLDQLELFQLLLQNDNWLLEGSVYCIVTCIVSVLFVFFLMVVDLLSLQLGQ
uniref:C3H1-type domain-containing protein n=1 Tax=Paramormyrops kingsleyae TaxID=1676925 RepID=A0A3B3QD17_9TELE